MYAVSTLFRTTWASAASTTSRGWSVSSTAQGRKLERKPCGTAAIRCFLSSRLIRSPPSDLPRSVTNTNRTAVRGGSACRSSQAGSAFRSHLILPVEPGHGPLRGYFSAGVVCGQLGGSPASGDLEGSDSLARGHQVTGHPDPG